MTVNASALIRGEMLIVQNACAINKEEGGTVVQREGMSIQSQELKADAPEKTVSAEWASV